MTHLARTALLSMWLVGAIACSSSTPNDGDPATSPDANTSQDDVTPDQCSLDACGVECVDLDTDPTNCGRCGLTCIVPNGSAGCVAGQCAVAACDDGFFDNDQDPLNGCEQGDDCTPDQACGDTCNAGKTVCNDGVASCVLARRVGVHRSSGNGHLYTTDLVAAGTAPYTVESANYFRVYNQQIPGTQPLYLCPKPGGKRFLTASNTCEGVGTAPDMVLGHWSVSQDCGSVPLHRLSHGPTNNHFYTLNAGERDNAVQNLGYVSEGIVGYVWTTP